MTVTPATQFRPCRPRVSYATIDPDPLNTVATLGCTTSGSVVVSLAAKASFPLARKASKPSLLPSDRADEDAGHDVG
jgi:hypothetical protein